MRFRKELLFGVVLLALISTFTEGEVGYTIEGNLIYVEDEGAFISASPHTLSGSGYVEFVMIPKTYTGNVNLVWLFDTEQSKPRKAEYYSPQVIERPRRLPIEYETVVSLVESSSPCEAGDEDSIYKYDIVYSEAEQEYEKTICFDGYTNSGDSYSFWYNGVVEQQVEWVDVSGAFNTANIDFNNKNKAYYKTNFPVTAGETYRLRAWIDVQLNSIGKYDFAAYPSSYGSGVFEAYQNGHLYLLDPWWNSSWGNRLNYTIYNDGAALENWTVELSVNTTALISANLMKSDCSDLVAANSTDHIIPMWFHNTSLGCNNISVNTSVWLNIPYLAADSNTSGSLYYNNSAAEWAINGYEVFIFFDDFVGSSLDTNNWTLDAGDSMIVGNSSALAIGGAQRQTIISVEQLGSLDFVSTSFVRWSNTHPAGAYINQWRDVGSATDRITSKDTAVSNTGGFITQKGGVKTETEVVVSDMTIFTLWESVFNSTHTLFYVNGTLEVTHTTNLPTEVPVENLFVGCVTPNDDLWIDYIHVRGWAPNNLIMYYTEDHKQFGSTCIPKAGVDWEIDAGEECVITGLDVTVGNITFINDLAEYTLVINESNITFESITFENISVVIMPNSDTQYFWGNGKTRYTVTDDDIFTTSIISHPNDHALDLGDYRVNITCGDAGFIGCADCGAPDPLFIFPINITINELESDSMEFEVDSGSYRLCNFHITGELVNTTAYTYRDGIPYTHRSCPPCMCPPGEYEYFYNTASVDADGNFEIYLCNMNDSNTIQFQLYDIADRETFGSCLTYKGYLWNYTAGASINFLALNFSEIDQILSNFTNVYTENIAFDLDNTLLLIETSINKDVEIYIGSSTDSRSYPPTSISPDLTIDLTISNFTLLNNFYTINMKKQSDMSVWDYSDVGDQSLTILCNENAPDTINLTELNLTRFFMSVKEIPVFDFLTNEELHTKYQPYTSSETFTIYNLDDNDSTIEIEFNLVDYTGDFGNSYFQIWTRVNESLVKIWQQQWYNLEIDGADLLNDTSFQYVLYTPTETRIISWSLLQESKTVTIVVDEPKYNDLTDYYEGVDMGFSSSYAASSVAVRYNVTEGDITNISFTVYEYNTTNQYEEVYATTVSSGSNSGTITYVVSDNNATYYVRASLLSTHYSKVITITDLLNPALKEERFPFYDSIGIPNDILGLDREDIYTGISMFLITMAATMFGAVNVGTGSIFLIGIIGITTFFGWFRGMTWGVVLFLFTMVVLQNLSGKRRKAE